MRLIENCLDRRLQLAATKRNVLHTTARPYPQLDLELAPCRPAYRLEEQRAPHSVPVGPCITVAVFFLVLFAYFVVYDIAALSAMLSVKTGIMLLLAVVYYVVDVKFRELCQRAIAVVSAPLQSLQPAW